MRSSPSRDLVARARKRARKYLSRNFQKVMAEEPHDTLGGFVFGELNRIGRVGDIVQLENASLRIVQMRGRRVEYVVLDPAPDDEAGSK